MKFRILTCSLMTLALAASLASAGTMDMTVQPITRYDALFNELPFVLDGDGRVASGQPGQYVMQVTFTASAGPGEKGWAGTAWNTAISGDPGLTKAPATYDPNVRQFDSNGPAGGGNVFIYQVNTDAGTPDDLDNISVAIASPLISNLNAFEKRNFIGTANGPPGAGVDPNPGPVLPAWIGNFSLDWDGVGQSDVNLVDHLFAFTTQNGTPTDYTDDAFLPSQQGAGATFGFGSLEDPFLVGDLFLGGALPGALITGGPLPTNDMAPDSVAWNPVVVLTGPDGVEAGASVDPLTGVFTWQSTALDSRGAYTATIQGTNAGGDPAGTDTGLLTFNLVPEPTSITLLGLAMVGLGFIRRR